MTRDVRYSFLNHQLWVEVVSFVGYPACAGSMLVFKVVSGGYCYRVEIIYKFFHKIHIVNQRKKSQKNMLFHSRLNVRKSLLHLFIV